MDATENIRRIIIRVLEAAEDACGQAIDAQLPDLSPEARLQEIETLSALLDKAKSHCNKAEAAMLKYIRSQSE
jgi:AMMECR1 domain-containing protein